VKRIIGLLLMFMTFMCITSYGNTDNNRWCWYASTSTTSYYWDKNTLRYNDQNNQAIVWIKKITLNSNPNHSPEITLVQKLIDFSNKKYRVTQYVSHYNNYSSTPTKANYLGFVYPDSQDEMLSNSISDQLGISHMYTNSSDRWRWIMSTDTYSIYIFSDIYEQSSNTYQVLIKRVYPNNPENRQVLFSSYTCNFTAGTVGIGNRRDMPIPGTINEAIYNAAYAIFKESH
jgi:hypothetical protein